MEIQPVNPKGNQSWIFIGRTDVEAETPIFWPPDAKNWLTGKDPGAGKDWRWEEKGTTEDEMVGWHHQLSGGVWVNSGSWWWTGKPGMLQSMVSQRVGHDWATELTDQYIIIMIIIIIIFLLKELNSSNWHAVVSYWKHSSTMLCYSFRTGDFLVSRICLSR